MLVRFLVFTLILSLLTPQFLLAQTNAVSPSELRDAVAAAAQARQKQLDEVRSFFAKEPVRAALKSGKVDYQKVTKLWRRSLRTSLRIWRRARTRFSMILPEAR